MDGAFLSLVVFAFGALILGAAAWSIQRYLPRFGLFVLGALGLPLWILIAALIPGFGKLLWIGLTAYLLFVSFAVFHYRRLRRAEFLQLLTAAAQSQLPIEEVLSQALRDRSTHPLRQMLMGIIHVLVPPFWFRTGRYDEQLRRLVYYLEMGFPPGMALACVPGLATQETELALFIGESTGKLAPSLQFAQRSQRSLGPVMLENVPRILYLGFLLVDWIAISIFILIFIAPKYEKIFADFKIRLPAATESVLVFGRGMSRQGPFLVLLALAFFSLLGALFCSPTVRWSTPIVRGIVKPWMQSRFLAMLGSLLEAGRSVPKSLDLLRQVPFFAGTVARRIGVVQIRVEQGRPLLDMLKEQGLLPATLVPLAVASEKAHNLPWAMQEMGEHLGRRTLQRVQRLGFLLFPLTILAFGALTLWFAIGYFSPLVAMLEAFNS
jgi:general secretion pathway protein F